VTGSAAPSAAGGAAESVPGLVAGDGSRQQNGFGSGGNTSGSTAGVGSRHTPKFVADGTVL
jgi:hypothetical protein